MTGSRIPLVGGVLTIALLALGVLFFFQRRDPMLLFQGFAWAFYLWIVLGIVFVMRHGIPVRIVGDERKP